jgi:hypothetical protein
MLSEISEDRKSASWPYRVPTCLSKHCHEPLDFHDRPHMRCSGQIRPHGKAATFLDAIALWDILFSGLVPLRQLYLDTVLTALFTDQAEHMSIIYPTAKYLPYLRNDSTRA